MPENDTLTIGELAVAASVSPDALRYYERRGLIAPTRRTAGGFRVYSPDVIDRLRFIKQAKQNGLTLREVHDLLEFDRRGANQCREVQRLLQQKLGELDTRLTQIQEFRRTLKGYLAQCERALVTGPAPDCPVVVRLKRPAR